MDRRAAERGEAHVPALSGGVLKLQGNYGGVQAVPAGPRADAHCDELEGATASLTELDRGKTGRKQELGRPCGLGVEGSEGPLTLYIYIYERATDAAMEASNRREVSNKRKFLAWDPFKETTTVRSALATKHKEERRN